MKSALSAIFIFIAHLLIGQEAGTVRGYVLDGGSGEPVIAANVQLVGERLGTTSDIDGFFSFNKIGYLNL